MNPISLEAAVVNFATKLLRGLVHDNENRIVFVRHSIPFLIRGDMQLLGPMFAS